MRSIRTRRDARRCLAVVCGLIVATGVAACGSSDDTSSASGSSTATATSDGKAATGTPIKVMTWGDYTQPPPSPSAQDLADTAKAFFKQLNADGGINGHPVELSVCDSKTNPNGALACGRQAIKDKVVAVVANESFFAAPVVNLLTKAGIPNVGILANDPGSWGSKLSYCVNSSVAGAFMGLGGVAKAMGATKMGNLQTAGIPQSTSQEQLTQGGIKKAGLQLGESVQVPQSTTDFAPAIAKALSGGADAIAVAPIGGDAGAIIRQIRQSNPDVKIVMPSFDITDAVIKSAGSAGDGVGIAGWTQPATADNVPGVKTFNAALDKYAPDVSRQEPELITWLGGELFRLAAEKVEGTVTSAKLVEALNSLENADLGGIVPNYSHSNAGKYGLGCVQTGAGSQLKLKGGKVVADKPGEFADVIPMAAK
ncbi:MAG TPA: ABC transporter substrate-binding protein [Baekduia sp.]|nr:ABC transporter substrate-binding protein [Baekduia sp.]